MISMIENFNGIGGRISKKLEEMGLKQVDVCNIINISKNAMSNYVSGKRIPDTMVIYKLSKFFSVSIEWLLTGEENENDLSVNYTNDNSSNMRDLDFELLSLYDQLTEREQGKVIGYIEALLDINDNTKENTSLKPKNKKTDVESETA